MSQFIEVAKVSDIPDGEMRLFEVDERLVLVARSGENFYCIDDVCTHDGGPLSDGQFDGTHVICPRHGARFDARTGEAVTMPATEDTVRHEVRIEDGAILVKLNQ